MQKEEITKLFVVPAQVTPLGEEDDLGVITASLLEKLEVSKNEGLKDIYTDLKTAAADPIYNGRPRMLHISAVIVHEGINRNGDGFYADDLRKAVMEKKLFKDGYAGMIDVNHDFMPVGYWYDAEFITDPATNTAGILAKGAIWAWRFPEVADKILADQHRNGSVPVSMSCICKYEDIDFQIQEDGRLVMWNSNPVFVATTVLFDLEPGDGSARGVADEDPVQITERERVQTLLRAAAQRLNEQHKEKDMLEELKPVLAESLGENAEKVITQITTAISSLEQKIDARDTELETLTAAKAEIEGQNAELQTTIEEQSLTIAELKSANEKLQADLDAQAETIRAFEEKEAEDAKQQKIEARLSELSEGVLQRLAAKDQAVQDAIKNRWANQTDEEWEITKAEHALASTTTRDVLPNPGSKAKSLDDFIL